MSEKKKLDPRVEGLLALIDEARRMKKRAEPENDRMARAAGHLGHPVV